MLDHSRSCPARATGIEARCACFTGHRRVAWRLRPTEVTPAVGVAPIGEPTVELGRHIAMHSRRTPAVPARSDVPWGFIAVACLVLLITGTAAVLLLLPWLW